ncbi:type II secretion system protein GspI [Pseudomonas sp. 09C 129]|uniref:type II secretion system minor pseudopilin GspI n=1 Tax=Pseudomonas sp. 09C 129 TaxID=2054915 RepID=UPI000C6D9A7C|nr:type II secretion system minor pseudopilin GspI [Pseudomonas sp. 09C 129]AUG04214.1 type II secretion system protein GspI [Pseudomonas sp. 09C 129]
MPRCNKQAGFTLLEVMVALAIFAVLSLSLYSATEHLIGNNGGLSERTLAQWLADNRLNELRAGMRQAQSQRQEPVRLAGRDWLLTSETAAAPDPRLLKIVLEVSTDAPMPRQRARLAGYLEARP